MRPRLRLSLRTVVFAALALALACAGEAVAQGPMYFGRNKVQYEGFDWHVLRTEHFDVYHPAEAAELAEIGAQEAEDAYRDLVHRFNFELQHRVPLVFYASNLHFRQTNVIGGFIPPGVGGFFEFLKGRVVIPADGDLLRFRRVIRHELVHVFTFTKLARVHRDHRQPLQVLPPLWFTEGLAEYWSGEADHQHEMMLRDAVASNYLVPLDGLDRIGGYLVYKQGEAACRFIAETYGEEKLLLLVDNAWRDLDFRKVMEHVLREPFRTTSDRYDAWVRAQYYPMLEEAAPAALTTAPVAVGGFHGKPAFLPDPAGGGTVAYVGNRGGYTNLYAVDVDASGQPTARPRVLVKGERGSRFETFHAFESRMDVASDGRLAFTTQSGETDVLHVYDPVSGRVEATYRFPDLVALYSPAWSPDGRALAFTGIARTGLADLYVYDTADATLRRLTADAYNDRDAAWHPDGSTLVFASDRTPYGENGAVNLFTLDLASGRIRHLTYGDHVDLSPRFSPDGQLITFASARRDASGTFGAQDLWVTDAAPAEPSPLALAEGAVPAAVLPGRTERRLTAFTGAAFDPVWTPAGTLLFSTYDGGRFTIRRLDADSLLAAPRETVPVGLVARDPGAPGWAHARHALGEHERAGRRPYRRRYSLDVAQGAVQTNPLWGTSGGAVLAFSDLLGDDRLLVTAYSADVPGRRFVDGLNVGLTRVHLGRRANVGYGAFRYSGLRFDRADPDADASYPVFFEQLAGGFGVVSYPVSRFQRVEVGASLAHNRKEVAIAQVDRDALLYSQSLALTHDNALYGWNGPLDGWKAQLGAGYTTDLRFSNVSYYTLSADVRRYTRIYGDVSLASWGLARANVGREARLFLLGGSWDLRGYPFLRVRGQHQWFTSHELRFPIAYAPSAYVPLLAPFGIVNLRGALFVDAARAWNESYSQREPQLLAGQTLGSAGAGLRMNLFGGIVLRWDHGWRFEDGFEWGERRPFSQFFFGYDF